VSRGNYSYRHAFGGNSGLTCKSVGGPPWLKSLLGRARETFAVTEMETMSSTSHEVCECWNGRSIVRVRITMLSLAAVSQLVGLS
jgi:hypothetical protein